VARDTQKELAIVIGRGRKAGKKNIKLDVVSSPQIAGDRE
jgi:hypothetical protein